ncbi:MAG: glycosyltransferase family 2 protein, partial [Oxalobacteraceae bacterium]
MRVCATIASSANGKAFTLCLEDQLGGFQVDASIIIPTFNRLWSLPDAIASCPRGDNIETIVVDDGSSDGTWDWLHRQHSITAIRQENWGKAAAIEAGLRVAKGRYVKFLDS